MTIGFAHRGGMAHYPENTLPAFTNALAMGAAGLESDVWITADGIPVLDHDGVVGKGRRERTIADLLRADLPAHIPSLEELYDACGTDFDLSLDVKDDAAALATMAVAEQRGALDRLWLCSPSRRLLRSWRAHSAAVRLIDSVPIPLFTEDRGARIAALAPLGVDALNIRYPAWTPRLIEEVHDAGKLAFAWGVQPRAVLRRLVRQGIDGLYSDHVDRLVDAVGIRGNRSGPAARP